MRRGNVSMGPRQGGARLQDGNWPTALQKGADQRTDRPASRACVLCWMTALHSRGISGKSPPTAARFRSLDALDSLKTNSDAHSSAFHSQGQKQKELWKDISCTNSIAKVRGQGFPSGSGSSSSTEAGVGTNRAKQQSCTQDRDWKLGVVGTASVVRRQITHSLP